MANMRPSPTEISRVLAIMARIALRAHRETCSRTNCSECKKLFKAQIKTGD